MEISIDYCETCNYRPIAASLAFAIRMANGMKTTLVSSGESGVFEVVVDGELVYSKKATGVFPKHEDIVEIINQKISESAESSKPQ